MKRKYWDLASGIAFLALSITVFVGAQNVKTLAVSSIGSGFFPSVVSVLLAITSIAIIAGGVFQARKAEPAAAPETKSSAEKKPSAEEKPRVWAVLVTFILMAAYALLITKVGFLITTTMYLFIQINILSPKQSRKQLMFAIISVVSAIAIYYTFVKVFNLMLPAGILG